MRLLLVLVTAAIAMACEPTTAILAEAPARSLGAASRPAGKPPGKKRWPLRFFSHAGDAPGNLFLRLSSLGIRDPENPHGLASFRDREHITRRR